jgi:site-specific recombinase XerD
VEILDKTKFELLDFSQSVCMIDADTDSKAIQSWLNEYKNNRNTYASYLGEIKKFVVFLGNKEIKLQALKKEHILEYIEWLKRPPIENIKSIKATERQVFRSGLSYKSVQYNIRVINSFLNYLSEAEYIFKNPIKLIKKFSKFADPIDEAFSIKARI